jgi:uroporphyrinogen decarboxylase
MPGVDRRAREGRASEVDTSRDLICTLFNGRNHSFGLREVSIWPETLRRWIAEGYPVETPTQNTPRQMPKPVDWVSHFGYDMAYVGGDIDYRPRMDYEEVLEETDEWVMVRDGAGAVYKQFLDRTAMPMFVDFQMTSRDIWEREYRSFLLTPDPTRMNLARTASRLAHRRSQGLWTYYQVMFLWETMRQCLGDMCMWESLVLNPGWLNDFNEVYTDFYIAHHRFLFEKVGAPDGIRVCDDLAYKNGLFCSPRTLSRLFLPYYRKLVDFYHSYGLLVEFHACGNINQALPLIAEAGFDAVNPIENKAGCDPLDIADRFGDRLVIIGGLDVRVLESGDRTLIRRTVADLLKGMRQRGARYVFGSDHSLTPLIAYDDYRCALDVFREHASR